jgi:lysophospholipase L1-like esterase
MQPLAFLSDSKMIRVVRGIGPWWKPMSQILALIVIFGLTLEICARMDDLIHYGASFWGTYSGKILQMRDEEGINRNCPNARFEKWKINAAGFRGEEVSLSKNPGRQRIFCLGASETFGLYEDPGKEWAAQLGGILPASKFEVINASIAGITLDRFVPYTRKYVLPFSPDLVILYINPYFFVSKLANGNKTNQEPAWEKTKLRGPIIQKIGLLPRVAPKIKRALKEETPRWLLQRYQRWNIGRELEAIEAQTLGGKRPLDHVPPEYLESFRQELASVVSFFQPFGIEVVLSSYPVLINQENLCKHPEIFLDSRRFCVPLSFAGMIEAPCRFNETIRSVAAAQKARYVDNFAMVPQEIRYFGDNVHYTNEGAQLVARNFGHSILKPDRPHE